MTVEIHCRQVATNGIHLNVAEAGPEDGPLVILLHGFPESWYGWRHQIDPLARAGYRVVAPDQRGYGGSDKPAGVASYRLDALVADLVGLVAAYGRDRAAVIGHDWGGIVAWAAIERHPDRFDRAVILNAPHPAVMRQALRKDLGQILKSWYVLLFQVPYLPEVLLRRNGFRALERAVTATSRPGAFDHADLELAKAAWGRPGALRSMIHWYRAALWSTSSPLPDPPITVPTLIIWGVGDLTLGPGLARSSYAQCQNAALEWIAEATHWVAHEQPEQVNRLILRFLGRTPEALGETNGFVLSGDEFVPPAAHEPSTSGEA